MPLLTLDQLLVTETDRIEWTESLVDKKVYQAISALANDLGNSSTPGQLLIGVDNHGAVRGLDEDALGGYDRAAQKLSSWLSSTKIWPHPSWSLDRQVVDGRVLWIVVVQPYEVPPAIAVDQRVWVRKGTTTRLANEADLQKLRERRPENLFPFDSRPVRGATIEDLDDRRLHERYVVARDNDAERESFPSLTAWLEQRESGRSDASGFVPNAAALLLNSSNPQRFIPGSYVEFCRYGGLDHDAPVATRRTVTGSVPDQFDALWPLLSANIAEVPSASSGVVEAYSFEYPPEAFKELFRNMLQHRLYEGTNAPARIEWFADRVVFSNPGGPFGRASEDAFGEHSDYRNTRLTGGLLELGYVQRLGRGVRRIEKQLKANGNPPLVVETDGFTGVTVRRRA
ncbi:MAG: putative DNA binding domain-containing protein [Vicinamibacteria bacterium]|nr:putative DNA binding domain-containing protein [Vicinamibacteria bacterium]